MANIFERTPQGIGGAFTSENCRLDIGGLAASGAGAIVQRVTFTINRPINFVYELSPTAAAQSNVYYIGGRRQGTATFERIVGGSATFTEFLNNYGPLCEKPGVDITLTAVGGCPIAAGAGGAPPPAAPLGKKIIYTLKTPKLTAVGASVSAQEIVILETASLVFIDLDVAEV